MQQFSREGAGTSPGTGTRAAQPSFLLRPARNGVVAAGFSGMKNADILKSFKDIVLYRP